jgi:16S rRNA (adenine1518-N6/adenine1519-N6)-dimethyltransferase
MDDNTAKPPPLRDVITQFGLKPDKSLGQHFLLDPDLLARIVAQAGDLAGLHVIEIGPGPGGLTRALLATGAAGVTAVEVDRRAVAAIHHLATYSAGRLHVMEADALKLKLPDVTPAPRAIIANLPYNIGTPLLIRWLGEAAAYQSMTLMFQLEVAARIVAAPNTPAYGRLSVISQFVCDAELAMVVPASAFSPPPKVESAVVRLIPKPMQPSAAHFAAMERLTAAAFGQRRKMLRGALRGLGGEALCEAAGIKADRRAETLTVAEFIRLMLASLARGH